MITKFSMSESPIVRQGVAVAHFSLCVLLLRSNRLDEGISFIRKLTDEFGESSVANVRPLVRGALLEQAKAQLRTDQPEAAIATAGRVLGGRYSNAPDDSVVARLLRAEGYFACRDKTACANELWGMLQLVPDSDATWQLSIGGLIQFAARYGPQWVLQLIEGASAGQRLLPLAVALRQELGERTKVSREVEEVAKDIRGALARVGSSRTESNRFDAV